MVGMMTELKKTGRVKFEAITTIALIVFCVFGCSIEDVAMKPVDSNFSDDSNLTSVVEPLPSLPVDPIHSPGSLDRAELDSVLEENLKKFAAEFSKTIPKPEKVDYERLKLLFQQTLMDAEPKTPENQYQFLCDANERWIYRCNLVTGEIVCYSMGSDYKLNRLDTVEGEK
ncbi:MAG: hypothetical protein CMI29_04205 [Opitutae bacterium]|nr:hypothetical protein [Opitutae bacterium]|tara:strand:- start:4728 stop:5240 length:513 start_codon:yes stop_codon:yes gene_type:complete